MPDKPGQLGDVEIAYDTLQRYLDKSPFFGTIVGRYGNRIGQGSFGVDGTTYTLPKNNGENHLHGGPQGFSTLGARMRPIEAIAPCDAFAKPFNGVMGDVPAQLTDLCAVAGRRPSRHPEV